MTVRFTSGMLVAALLTAALPAAAQQSWKDNFPGGVSKEQLHDQMRVIAQEIEARRAVQPTDPRVAQLLTEYESIRNWLGGDDPAQLMQPAGRRAATASAQSGVARLSPPGCGQATTTINVAGSSGPITAPTPYTPPTFTAVVSGADPYLWDLNLTTFITHTFAADLDITLTSPAGTIVTITTDNGGGNDDVFNGTVWDDNANDPVTDHTFTNLTLASPLSPEGRLSAFRGQNPNGVWTLTVADDLGGDFGNLSAWNLDLQTLPAAPVFVIASGSSSPGLALTDNGVTSDSINFAGQLPISTDVDVTVNITHTNAADLDIRLISPSGTIVPLTTDNGGTNDNVFAGTLFSRTSTDTVTDHIYTNLVTATPLSPEGATDVFIGENPNGNWTLQVTDDAATGLGTLVSWSLNVCTTGVPLATSPFSASGTTGPLPDSGTTTVTPTVFTALVSGAGASTWDIDLTTFITHTANADLDMTLTSPAGTVVTISTDNGGTNDNGFNGTVWDDNVNDGAVDHVYTNLVTATPLSPEGRLSNFRGENPNGTWTLTITDDAVADNGTLNSWALDVTTVPGTPGEASSTFTSSPGSVIGPGAGINATDVIAVSGVGTFLTEVELYVEIPHTFASDLDITLMSPAGTIIPVTTDNGAGNDNVFVGTTFDSDVSDPVTDHVYTNLVAVPLLSPEGAFDNFRGQDPNGNWTLVVADDAAGDGGTLVRWDLIVRTCVAGPGTEYCAGDGLSSPPTTPCPCGNTGAAGNGCASSFNAAGAHITGSGTTALDNVVLTGTGMQASGICVFLQGDAIDPNGFQFGDGMTCTGGALVRLRGVALGVTVPNGAQFPGPPETITLSQRGGVTVGSGAIRSYTVFYRNAAVGFCPPFTFNTRNSYRITW